MSTVLESVPAGAGTGTPGGADARKDTAGAGGQRPGWQYAAPLLLGLALLYGPSFHSLYQTIWQTDDQGHGPLILGASIWLVWSIRENIAAAAASTDKRAGFGAWALLVLSMLVYVFGRVQSVILLEVGSLIPALAASVALAYGWPAVKAMRFPLFFLLFLVPLPGFVIDSLTSPLKLWVSEWAEFVLTTLGYPVGRSGVTLSVGQYQLLVADACSGLNSMFSLTAVGLFYVYLMQRPNMLHNTLLLVSIPFVAYIANVTRVVIICLVTYHLGDEAGQGFIHGAAGIVLFVVSLTLMFTLDAILSFIFRPKKAKAA